MKIWFLRYIFYPGPLVTQWHVEGIKKTKRKIGKMKVSAIFSLSLPKGKTERKKSTHAERRGKKREFLWISAFFPVRIYSGKKYSKNNWFGFLGIWEVGGSREESWMEADLTAGFFWLSADNHGFLGGQKREERERERERERDGAKSGPFFLLFKY